MRQQLPYTASSARGRTTSESSIHNLDDAPPPPALGLFSPSGGKADGSSGSGGGLGSSSSATAAAAAAAAAAVDGAPPPPPPPLLPSTPSQPPRRPSLHDANSSSSAWSPSSTRSLEGAAPPSSPVRRAGSLGLERWRSWRESRTAASASAAAASAGSTSGSQSPTAGGKRSRVNTWDAASSSTARSHGMHAPPGLPDIGAGGRSGSFSSIRNEGQRQDVAHDGNGDGGSSEDDGTRRVRYQQQFQQQQFQQQQQQFQQQQQQGQPIISPTTQLISPLNSSFGTGAEPDRDAAIASTWLSSSDVAAGSSTGSTPLSGGGGSLFGGPSPHDSGSGGGGRLPSYRRSGASGGALTAAAAAAAPTSSGMVSPVVHSAALSDSDTLPPYDADDGLGDDYDDDYDDYDDYYGDNYDNGGYPQQRHPHQHHPLLSVPHLAGGTAEEEKEEILPSGGAARTHEAEEEQQQQQEIEQWLGGVHTASDSLVFHESGTAEDASEGRRNRPGAVRWMSSEGSDLSISVVDEEEEYYRDEEDGADEGGDGEDSDSDQSSSWRRRQRSAAAAAASAAGGRNRTGDGGGVRRSHGANSLRSPSVAASMSTKVPPEPVRLCGITLPLFLTTCPPRIEKPSWNRVSSYIVRHAPCFWCGARLEESATDRDVLGRLNVLCAIFAFVQAGSGIFLFVVQWLGGSSSPEEAQLQRESLTPNLWALNTMVFLLGFVGIALFATMILTLRVIREVNLVGAVRYMWALYWIIPIEILLVVSLFDYHRVTDVWVRHFWLTPSFDWFRSLFCQEGTAEGKCMVPTDGGAEYDSEDAWCEANYNATDCSQIKIDAQTKMATVSYFYLTANAIWGLLLVVLLCLALTMLEGIITSPIVQSSKQSNIPAWLTLPILGCLAGGATLLFSPSSAVSNDSGSEIFWVGIAYMSSGGSFLIAALLGWFISAYSVLNSRDKQHKQIAVSLFIMTILLTIFILVVVFASSLVFSVDLVDYGVSDEERGLIACYVDTANSCTNCYPEEEYYDPNDPQCPEWTQQDILIVLQTQLKQSATLAAIFLIYAFSALRFGFVLRSHVARYQIEYV